MQELPRLGIDAITCMAITKAIGILCTLCSPYSLGMPVGAFACFRD